MNQVAGREFVIDRARDVWVWDHHGRRYLDATASLWYCNVGHGRAEIIEAIASQLRKLDAYAIFGDLTNVPARELAERLVALAPQAGTKVFLTSGGGDAIETAAKLARRYWLEVGESSRTELVTRRHGYHGTHGFGTAMAGIAANREGWGPLAPAASVVAHDSVEALRERLSELGEDRVAAVFVEPVIGAGGVYPPPPGYLEGVQDVCRETGALLIADCVICGFGRLGTPLGVERWGLEPDLIAFAKGVTSGYQPLGGVMVSPRVAEPFWHRPEVPPVRHGPTYAGHPAACAAALANLDVLDAEDLMSRGQDLEGTLSKALAPLADHELVGEIRAGTGLMAAVEIAADARERAPAIVGELVLLARQRGVLTRALPTALAISPPLTIDPAELDEIAEAIIQSLIAYR